MSHRGKSTDRRLSDPRGVRSLARPNPPAGTYADVLHPPRRLTLAGCRLARATPPGWTHRRRPEAADVDEPMMNVTFDTNCIIALEENEQPTADALRRIVRSAPEQKLRLRVVAISASERPRRGATPPGFDDFERKIANAGLEGLVEILAAPAIWNVTFWNESEWTSQADDANEEQIHRILFPNRPFDLSGELEGKRLNCMIDTWALLTHLNHGGGAFVTADRNFHTKKATLEHRLDTSILTPAEAAARFCAP